jgi:exodeoxyribonuclease X
MTRGLYLSLDERWGSGHLLFRVIDIETTGLAPPAEIIEIGRVDVFIEGETVWIEKPKARLYRPLNGIPPETKAVHHITEADLPTYQNC